MTPDLTLHKRIRSEISDRILSGDWAPGHVAELGGGKSWRLCVSGFQFAIWEAENP
jgi:hypothetical protein